MDINNRTEQATMVHYWRIKLFPKATRDDILKLYSFVQVVHSYTDQLNPDVQGFKQVRAKWKTAKKSLGMSEMREGDSSADSAARGIAYVVHRYGIDPLLVDVFLDSIEMDLTHKPFENAQDILEYTYGSSAVPALIIAKIVGLREEAYELAVLQARAIQQIHFILGMNQAMLLGRQYFPNDEIAQFGLKNLSEKEIARKPAEFREFIQFQVTNYHHLQEEADSLLKHIPKRLRTALRTAIDMYSWASKRIYDDPMILFKSGVRPSKQRLIGRGVVRSLYS